MAKPCEGWFLTLGLFISDRLSAEIGVVLCNPFEKRLIKADFFSSRMKIKRMRCYSILYHFETCKCYAHPVLHERCSRDIKW